MGGARGSWLVMLTLAWECSRQEGRKNWQTLGSKDDSSLWLAPIGPSSRQLTTNDLGDSWPRAGSAWVDLNHHKTLQIFLVFSQCYQSSRLHCTLTLSFSSGKKERLQLKIIWKFAFGSNSLSFSSNRRKVAFPILQSSQCFLSSAWTTT